MTKPLLAILLLLQLVAQTHGKQGLEGNSSESPDVMQKQYCLIAEEIEAKLRLERRFKSMGNSGAAGRIGDERRSLSEKEKELLQRIKKKSILKCQCQNASWSLHMVVTEHQFPAWLNIRSNPTSACCA